MYTILEINFISFEVILNGKLHFLSCEYYTLVGQSKSKYVLPASNMLVYLLIFSSVMLKNGQTYFKNLAEWALIIGQNNSRVSRRTASNTKQKQSLQFRVFSKCEYIRRNIRICLC